MLRTLVLALALGVPGIAAAQDQFRDSAIGAEVVGDRGDVVGRVDHIERDADGRVVAVEVGGLEPASAPYASRDLVASNDPNAPNALFISDRRDDQRERPVIDMRSRTR